MPVTTLVAIPGGINENLSSAKQATMLSLLGAPRQNFDQNCREVTNTRLRPLIVFQSVGPFRVSGLLPAVTSLRQVIEDIGDEAADVHAVLGSAGMLCARNVRGSQTAISNHAWGTAVDLTLEGVLDVRGDGRVQEGLARIAPIFNRHGWYWGAAFRTEDAMHFECSEQMIRRWADEGVFRGSPTPASVLSLGDRGPEVRDLQQRLNAKGADLVVDGDFGRATHAAVMAFQAQQGLFVDGVVGPKTRTALGLA